MYLWASNRVRDPGACDYYRVKVPLYWLEKLGFMQCYEDRGTGGESDIAAMFTADIDLFYATSGADTLHQITTLNGLEPGKIQDGSVHYPPTTVWDCDDNPDYVHPFNQTFAASGVRHYPSGEFLEPGETLEFEDAKGEKRTLWEDRVTTALAGQIRFDIARNLHVMKTRWEVIRSAVGVTVPSQALASYIRDVLKQSNVYVFPNTIVPEDYEEFPLVRDDTSIRILWQGGMSHFIDWFPLREAIATVLKKYPQAKLVVWGEKFDWITDIIPTEQLEFHPWTPYPAFKLKRGLLQTDINLCPLANNAFNRCKSAIKWYEGSVWHRPEATLAADVVTYREIKDGETGLLYSTPAEFVQKLGLLIEDASLRKRLGASAKEWVLANRTPRATIPGLYEFYQDCRARTKGSRIISRLNPTFEKLKSLG
jgi:hypothetical protein